MAGEPMNFLRKTVSSEDNGSGLFRKTDRIFCARFHTDPLDGFWNGMVLQMLHGNLTLMLCVMAQIM
jgi:hypothetical protein